jgi:hypothetical protein
MNRGELPEEGRAVRPEEVEQQFRALKAGLESGAITDEEFDTEIRRFLFQDLEGDYWTIGAQTEEWYRYQDGEWAHASPPSELERAERKMERPQEAPDDAVVPSRRRLRTPLVATLASLFVVVCLLAVAITAYQYGKMSTIAPLPTQDLSTPTMGGTAGSAVPELSPTSGGEQVSATAMVEASMTPTTLGESATSAPRPTYTPTIVQGVTPTSVQAFVHRVPVLLEPEDGAQRGPGYAAVLMWRAVQDLRNDEYYHVEVCWNECTIFWGDYVRDTSWTFPDFLRGQAIDATYHWHVTVRREIGDAPAGPGDPATSPTSETWAFLLPET